MEGYSFGFILLFVVLFVQQTQSSENDTLVLVHAIFRHGDRTPDYDSLVPTDPYLKYDYPPYGQGELINEGKLREYKIGQYLNQRYHNFLGETYTPNILEAWSSAYNRTKMSLQLVLAGLFPPKSTQIWNEDLPWQPIPFNTMENNNNTFFLGFMCPKFLNEYAEFLKTPRMRTILAMYDDVFEYATEHSGKEIRNFFSAAKMYDGFLVEEEFNLTLPEWTSKIYPEPLRTIEISLLEYFVSTEKLARLAIGSIIKKIVIDTKGKMAGTLRPEGKKMFLYSGHDVNVALLLNALQIYQSHLPPYGAFILVEIHEIENVTGVKIFYQDYSQPEPILLKLKDCAEFCPWNQFLEIVNNLIPSDDEEICT